MLNMLDIQGVRGEPWRIVYLKKKQCTCNFIQNGYVINMIKAMLKLNYPQYNFQFAWNLLTFTSSSKKYGLKIFILQAEIPD